MFHRRLAIPLALSFLGHALLLLIAALLPDEADTPRPSGSAKTTTLTMNLAGPKQKPVAFVDPKDWVDVHIGTGTLVLPAAGVSARSPAPNQAPTVRGVGDTFPGNSRTGTNAGPGMPTRGSQVVVVPGNVRRVVYLLDRSVSMGLSDALDRGRIELAASLRTLAPETLFQVFVYNRTARPLIFRKGLLPASADNISRVLRELEAVNPGGDTCHVEAIRAALMLRPELLILLSDADDLSSRDIQLISVANQGRTLIDTVELTRDPHYRPDAGLALLARLNGGQHRRIVLGR